ncbi:ADA32 protein, partial [Corythaeola cristata]|nr:ADA32 protein [Corythaeola cristata]
RGLLQFENVSYGIEPLGYSATFEHFVYRVGEEQAAGSLLDGSHPRREPGGPAAQELPAKAPGAAARSPKYFQVYVVLDKALYNYMGSDENAAMQKIIQVFNLVNNMFHPLNVTVVLSSLELWAEENKISTAGEADDLLQRFLQWEQSYLARQPYDAAYLLVPWPCRPSRQPVAGERLRCCSGKGAAAAPLPAWHSVLAAAQTLGWRGAQGDSGAAGGQGGTRAVRSRDPPLAHGERAHSSGAKPFSSCSIGDFEAFLKHDGGTCLFSRPRLIGLSRRRRATCGNGVVEPGEQCDCGTAEACLKDKCCTNTCRFKPGVKCSVGLCCDECQFRQKQWRCRRAADAQCDLDEFCDGSSASCPPDRYVQDGHGCERGTGYCYKGRCQSPDLQCRRLYGRGSENAPVACYEELNSQQDRFGHCGFRPRAGYRSCAWRNLRCGKLVCTYPYSTPFPSDAAAVLYVRVREHLCVSLDY